MKRHLVVLRRYEPVGRIHGGGRKQGEVIRYAECRKNHAAATGGYAVDGCVEFVPVVGDGGEGALQCTACGCHRSFHRRVVVDVVTPQDGDCASSQAPQ